MFNLSLRSKVVQFKADGSRWLSTGWDGGFSSGNVAYALQVPTGWDETNLRGYVTDRRERAKFTEEGPSLLTAVNLEHLRGARCGPVEVYATVGLSNPAALPIEPRAQCTDPPAGDSSYTPGTVNLIIGSTHALDDGALSNLLTVAAEAKAATLLSETGFPGTTTDAIIVACDPSGEAMKFTGSATRIGAATRAAVRDVIKASLRSHYPGADFPRRVEEAAHGVSTDLRGEVFEVRL